MLLASETDSFASPAVLTTVAAIAVVVRAGDGRDERAEARRPSQGQRQDAVDVAADRPSESAVLRPTT